MNKPKISVIIPVYNVEQYLPRCLDSVINQTFKDIEIICINDCSTDKSLAILKNYAIKDNRIKIIDLLRNQGASAARNKGIDNANGEYISFIDPDDYIDLNYFEELCSKAQTTDADIVKAKRVIILKDGSKTFSKLNQQIQTDSKFNFSNEWTTAIYKSSLIFDNNIRLVPQFIVAEDVAFLNEIVLKANRIEIIENVRYYYCRRDNSLNQEIYSKEKILSNLDAIEYILNIYDNALNRDISTDRYIKQYVKYLNVIRYYIIDRTKDVNLKKVCAKKYIEFFRKCKKITELEAFFNEKNKRLLDYIKNNEADKILNYNAKNYCSYKEQILAELRENIKKDLVKK